MNRFTYAAAKTGNWDAFAELMSNVADDPEARIAAWADLVDLDFTEWAERHVVEPQLTISVVNGEIVVAYEGTAA